jgi:hypothetical protein
MPPRVETPKEQANTPPDGRGKFTFDVERIAAPNSSDDQLFRFTIEVIKVLDAMPAGGTLKVFRHKTDVTPAQTLLFSVVVPNPKQATPAERAQVKYIAELVVHGRVPVKHDPNNCFSLQWVRAGAGARLPGPDHVVYPHKIATFTPAPAPASAPQ